MQEAVLQEVRLRLASGDLAPGQRLRLDELGAELGVSRVPVKEALKVLEGEGLVEHTSRGGSRVVSLSLDDLHELYRMRELLEPEAIRSAVPRLDDDDVAHLLAQLDEIRSTSQADDLLGWARASRTFYLDLIGYAARPLLVRTLRRLWDASEPYRALWAASAEERAGVAVEHEALAEALRAGDAEAVVAAQARRRERAFTGVAAVLGNES